ncbi:hypothetical protein HELRODRAFT_89262, partial [Helobdella robusta]|uniref:BZIP domain-containing protein n=1 Tax=Helobdella robusta TaxID=6412 RepID=T1G7B1_HELRO
LYRHKLTDEQIRFIKDVRKRGKNKMAAQNCRKRKLDIIQVLEDDVDSLKKEREQMKEEKRMVDKDIEMMRNKIEQLQKEIFESLQTANERYFFNEALNNDGRSYTRNRVFDSNRRGNTLALNGNFINISAGSLNNGYNSNNITKNISENK